MSSSNIKTSSQIFSKEPTSVASDSVQRKKGNPERAGFQRDLWIKLSNLGIGKGYLGAEKKMATEIIDRAQSQAQIIEREAYEKAFALGEKAGTEVASRKFQSALDSLDKAKKEFDRLIQEVIHRSEPEFINLCLAVCKKVLSVEISENRDVVVNVIKGGLQSILDTTSVKIRINPANLEYVQQHLDEIMAAKDGLKDVILEGDERIEKGDVVIETSFGNIDSRIDKKMEEIEKQFLKVLNENKGVPG